MYFYSGFLTLVFLLFVAFAFEFGLTQSINGGFSSSSNFNGYIQEITLYDTLDETGNYLYFQSNLPNTASFQNSLKKTQRVCFRGRWDAYASTDYENKSAIFDSWTRKCVNQTFEHKSIRHMAASNTSQSAISLYTGKDWTGLEYFVSGDEGDRSQFSGIQEPIRSFALSGHLDDSWELFEGTHFNGSSGCARKFHPILINSYNEQDLHRLFNLTTVGSVRQTCYTSPASAPSPSI